jgi:hypothetical protein
MTYAFAPELAAIAAVLPELDITDIPAARAAMVAMREQQPPFETPDSITIRKRMVPGAPGDPDVEVAVFTPLALAAARRGCTGYTPWPGRSWTRLAIAGCSGCQ